MDHPITRRRCGNCVSFQPDGEPVFCTNAVSFIESGQRRAPRADDAGCDDHMTADEDLADDRHHAAARALIVELFGASSLRPDRSQP